ncbi:hypothetical protein [Thauera sinica]|uniref:DUF4123 domain-containing protein n=1 Tax=Thauera sinica TaxID=2665146 RepID=A0ABW1ATU6_9RHOO|nr:hypothetical protein [Thauera sp. K11]
MSNVVPLLPKLTLNRRFAQDFVDSPSPCCALGLVEERKETYALIALRPGVALPADITNHGFEFGHTLLGTSQYEVVHLAFDFPGFATYHVVVNPSDPGVRVVLRHLIDEGNYFILVIDPAQLVTAFRDEGGKVIRSGLAENWPRIARSATTAAQYDDALAQFRRRPEPPGWVLEWVCRGDPSYLDLANDRMELAPTPTPATGDTGAAQESAPASKPNWQPLSMLPMIALVMAEELAGAEDLHASLQAAMARPQCLDAATLQRSRRLCENQLEMVPTYREQVARWCRGVPSRPQQAELTRLSEQIERFEAVVNATRVLVDHMTSGSRPVPR